MNSSSIGSSFDQSAWQQTFYRSLTQQASTDKQEIHSSENKKTFSNSHDHQNIKIDFPIWAYDLFDHSLFQKSLSSNHNEKVISVAKKVFEANLPELKDTKDLFIGFTGSDGREEKLSPHSSPIEILVGFRGKEGLKSVELEKIRTVISKDPTLFHQDIEIKCLDSDSLINHIDSQGDERPFPTRAWDSCYLSGNKGLFTEYKKSFFREIQDPKNSKTLKNFQRETVRKSFQVLNRTLGSKDKSQIDLETGKVFYDGKKKKGVKYPYLRPIQYKLGMHVFSLIQNNKISLEEFLQMPVTTVDRIQWLADKKFIKATAAEIKTYQRAYIASLVWFGIAQKNFEVLGQTETIFPAKDLKEVAETIVQFCDKLVA
jgi:hypothetical protein